MPELVMGKNALHEDPADPEPEDARQMVQNAEMRLRKRQVSFPSLTHANPCQPMPHATKSHDALRLLCFVGESSS